MALVNDVLLQEFPVEPRAGWSMTLVGPGATQYRTYNDEPVCFQNGQLTRAEFNIVCKVTPYEATQLASLCDKANGRPFLFRNPWDFHATALVKTGPYLDYSYGGFIRTGTQTCPIKVRGLMAPDGTRREYVKPIFMVENLRINGLPETFDPLTRRDFNPIGNIVIGSEFVSAEFDFLTPVRMTSLDIDNRSDPNKTIALNTQACDGDDLVSISVSLEESYDWLIDDAFVGLRFNEVSSDTTVISN